MSPIKEAWILLGMGVVADMLGTTALKKSVGFSLLLPTAFCATCYTGAVWLMALATKQIDIGLAYALWAGASTALIVGSLVVLNLSERGLS